MFEVTKDPSADLDYGFDWSAWLGTDTITESTWNVPGASGITMHDPTVAVGGQQTTVWLSGGHSGIKYVAVTNHIKTAGGREDFRSLHVTIERK